MTLSPRRFRGVVVAVAVAVAAALVGCSGGGGGTEQPEGLSVAEACGGLAQDAAVAAALTAVLGSERFEDDLSTPDKALDRLRDDSRAPWADSYQPQPVRYCGLVPAEGDPKGIAIELAAARGGPYLGPELARKVTSYVTGREAFSSAGLGKLYFTCRLKAPAHDLVVETAVRGPAGHEDTDLEQRTRLITLANAAARHVADELGCSDTRLVDGVPAEAKP